MRLLQAALEQALAKGWVSDAAVAQADRERDAFWRLRESIPEAQRKDGYSLKHDISVPVSQVPRFIEVAGGWVAQHIPQGVLISYGHLGDGNLHFNVNQRPGTQIAQLQAVEQKVKRAIHDFVKEFGGSFSRRARHRPVESVRARALRQSGGARSHEAHQARARS